MNQYVAKKFDANWYMELGNLFSAGVTDQAPELEVDFIKAKHFFIFLKKKLGIV